ncbi:transcription factor Adf-1-like [Metopolophium dirhodum]|uniref:transcription factor Adf-1-like n=1 Tax=Metopolophium dirhodum TaxID=44670 RepID=UPI0029902EE7|nr:transcription factor Adf-1-like [Metopolophium dirhodum]
MSAIAFTPQEDELFIESERKYPELYDCSHMQYFNLIIKDSKWKEISQNIGKSVEDCKKRWKNIRDSYNRNKRKLDTGSERSLKKKWPLAAHVSFLDKVQHERSSSSNISVSESASVLHEEGELDIGIGGEFNEGTEEKEKTTDSPRRIRSKQDKLAVILATRNGEQKKLIAAIQSQNETILNRKMNEDDEIDLFFKSLAMTMKKLPTKGINEIKLKTLALVAETEEKYAA